MSDAKRLLDLAARVEALEGPDHCVDAEIALALYGYTLHEESGPSHGAISFWTGEPWASECQNSTQWPHFTKSIEDALTLVPKGFWWTVNSYSSGVNFGAVVENDDIEIETKVFPAPALPALALCAVCLRARATTTHPQETGDV